MTAGLALAGWLAAAAALAGWVGARRRLASRLELVARADHELRGPLAAVGLGLEALGRARRPPSPATLAAVEGALGRARLALDDLSAARSGRRGGDRSETVEVGEVLRRTAEQWAAAASARGVELVLAAAPPAVVRGDARRLAQATGNLVANALEHGAGPVVVSGRARGREGADRGRRSGARPAGPRGRARRPRAGGSRGPGARAGHRGRDRRPPRRLPRRRPERARGPARARPPGRWRPGAVSRRRRAALLLGLALLLGGLAASDVARREAALERRLGPLVPVLVTRAAQPAGRRLAPAALALREIPARFAPAGALADPAEAVGLVAAASLPAGAPLGPGSVRDPEAAAGVAAGVRPGERVATVVAQAPRAGVASGGRVDVLVTREGRSGAGGRTELALQDVEVLGARAAPASGGDESPGRRVEADLRVTLRQAVFLAAAQSFAREVRLLPRAAGDRGREPAAVGVDDRLG